MKLLIKNGRVVDPASKLDATRDILIENGIITALAPLIAPDEDARVLDAFGLTVCPGLIDIHCHLREPGYEYKEDIASGTRSAAAGGFTTVCCMPNTRPVTDDAETLSLLLTRIRKSALINVRCIAAATLGQKGETLSAMAQLRALGAVAFSDDGRPVEDDAVMLEAMRLAASLGAPLVSHCEVLSLSGGGAMNEGETARRLGVRGIPRAAEETMVRRDAALSLENRLPIHIAHVSTMGSVEIIRAAKKKGAPLTAETCPHYMLLDESAVETFGTNAKMSPPLRTRRDVEAIVEGLMDGTIDVIATDHAPHSREEKAKPLSEAPFGIIGFETALPAALTALHDKMPLSDILAKFTCAPAAVFGLDRGRLAPGKPADLTLFAPDQVYIAGNYRSKSSNSCFTGMALRGSVKMTVMGGNIIDVDG